MYYDGQDKPPAPPAWVKTLHAARAWGLAPWEITGESGILAKKIWIERENYCQPHEQKSQELRIRKQIYGG